jgi:indole-3-glycerol phosphate synthase
MSCRPNSDTALATKIEAMATQLDQILAHTLIEVNRRKAEANLPELERQAVAHIPRGFGASLRRVGQTGPAIIAEIKKASPSRGLIRADFRPSILAPSLQVAGAAALSVLTDEEFFQGSLADLEAASSASSIPILRKDFILDPFQILEARAAGADAILLIVAALSDDKLDLLHAFATDLGLDVLVETHDRAEIDRAIALGADIIGVNSRDLRSFTVRSESLLLLAESLPQDVLRVAESGIRTAADISSLRVGGYNAFLIGEALMRQTEPAVALALLLDREFASTI